MKKRMIGLCVGLGLTMGLGWAEEAPKPVEVTQPQAVQSQTDTQPAPELAEYLKQVQTRVLSYWVPPRRTQKKLVVVRFTVNKYGHLVASDILQSSNDAQMDASAETAVKAAEPFPPLPKQYDHEAVNVEINFDYAAPNKVPLTFTRSSTN